MLISVLNCQVLPCGHSLLAAAYRSICRSARFGGAFKELCIQFQSHASRAFCVNATCFLLAQKSRTTCKKEIATLGVGIITLLNPQIELAGVPKKRHGTSALSNA